MKLIICIFLLFNIAGCEPWIMLKQVSTSITNKIDNLENDYYILENDTIKVNCLAVGPEPDSTSEFFVVEILTRNENSKWENMTSYLLIDNLNRSIEPTEIKKNPSSSYWRYRYEIIFESNEKMKGPLVFNFTTLTQKTYYYILLPTK